MRRSVVLSSELLNYEVFYYVCCNLETAFQLMIKLIIFSNDQRILLGQSLKIKHPDLSFQFLSW
jgi:hypothetical protein